MRALRKRHPSADIVFLADRKNAPFGTKSAAALRAIVCADLLRLKQAGAARTLVACCTASSVCHTLPHDIRASAFPIISPIARAAVRATRNGRIGVLATDATVRSDAFPRAIASEDKTVKVYVAAASPLVSLVESGRTHPSDVCVREAVENLTRPLCNTGIDTLILGCTHFPALAEAIAERFPDVRLISSVEEGTRAFGEGSSRELLEGTGRTVIL